MENPTRAPGHRNFRRFALLSAQMVAIGVELESEKVGAARAMLGLLNLLGAGPPLSGLSHLRVIA